MENMMIFKKLDSIIKLWEMAHGPLWPKEIANQVRNDTPG